MAKRQIVSGVTNCTGRTSNLTRFVTRVMNSCRSDKSCRNSALCQHAVLMRKAGPDFVAVSDRLPTTENKARLQLDPLFHKLLIDSGEIGALVQ